jgi:4-alpha-glucanotransferase
MTINFYVGFRSQQGQSVGIKIGYQTKERELKTIEIPLQYLNDYYWHVMLDLSEYEIEDEFEYSYIYRDSNRGEQIEFCKNSLVNIKKTEVKAVDIIDDWRDDTLFRDVFTSKPFISVLNPVKEKVKATDTKKPTHIFKVNAPVLAAGKVLCLTGAGKKLKDWHTEKPLILDFKKNQWLLKLNLAKEDFPIEYKLGVYDLAAKQMEFEGGPNRIIPASPEKSSLTILHQTFNPVKDRWKGTGVNIPVSSLKSAGSWEWVISQILTNLQIFLKHPASGLYSYCLSMIPHPPIPIKILILILQYQLLPCILCI